MTLWVLPESRFRSGSGHKVLRKIPYADPYANQTDLALYVHFGPESKALASENSRKIRAMGARSGLENSLHSSARHPAKQQIVIRELRFLVPLHWAYIWCASILFCQATSDLSYPSVICCIHRSNPGLSDALGVHFRREEPGWMRHVVHVTYLCSFDAGCLIVAISLSRA